MDFGSLCSNSLCEAPNAPNFGVSRGFWILGILDFGFRGFWILDFRFGGFWILDSGDFGFWILAFGDFGFWILEPKSKIQNPQIQNPKSKLFWPNFADFGFWMLDLGFWTVM